jgi:hypothetical protein
MADPGGSRLEVSGFFGVDRLNEDIALGSAVAPEQRPQTGPMFGGRLTYMALRSRYLAFGLEAEASLTTSWTGYGFEDSRMSYFAPIIGVRSDAILRLRIGWLQPHIVGGAGSATVASSSPFMKKETDVVYFWGPGVSFPIGRWTLRFDGRQAILPARDADKTTATYELAVAIGRTFGGETHHRPIEHVEEPPPIRVGPIYKQPLIDKSKDTDRDGIPERMDNVPTQPKT